jgi:hypothetical protein
MNRNTSTWAAFLLVCFAVVGLMGAFASYAAPLPLERALARDGALDDALAAGDSKPALEPLRERLDDSAALVIDGTGPLSARVATARAAMHVSLLHESDVVGDQLRFELLIITVVAGVFGTLMLVSAARPSAKS